MSWVDISTHILTSDHHIAAFETLQKREIAAYTLMCPHLLPSNCCLWNTTKKITCSIYSLLLFISENRLGLKIGELTGYFHSYPHHWLSNCCLWNATRKRTCSIYPPLLFGSKTPLGLVMDELTGRLHSCIRTSDRQIATFEMLREREIAEYALSSFSFLRPHCA